MNSAICTVLVVLRRNRPNREDIYRTLRQFLDDLEVAVLHGVPVKLSNTSSWSAETHALYADAYVDATLPVSMWKDKGLIPVSGYTGGLGRDTYMPHGSALITRKNLDIDVERVNRILEIQ